ncbi:MAG TPA: PAS domain S-box protein, partial [Bacteroidales bacterium]|nr:PAS domain S-box protein [Bacteroidales bacterium]
MNPVAEKLCGWPLQDALGKPILDIFNIVNANNRQRAENPGETVLSTGKVVGLANHTVLISKSGKEYHIADSAAPILTTDGEIAGVVMVFSDVTEKYEKAQALAASEQKLRHIIEHSTNTFFSHDVEGNILYFSPQISNLIGYEVSEAIGNWTRFLSDNPVNNLGVELTRKAIETGEAQPPYELELIHKDGSKVWVEIYEAPVIENGKVVAIVGSNNDITERKEAEAKIRESEERYRNLFDLSMDAILLMEDDKIVQCNLAALRMFGCMWDQIHGKLINDFSPEFQHNNVPSAKLVLEIIEAANLGVPKNFEWVFRRANGSLFNAEVSLNRVKTKKQLFLQAIVRDVTAKKKADQNLKESEEKFRAIVENMGEGLFLSDLDDRIIYANERIREIYGYDPADLIGKVGFEILIHPNDWVPYEEKKTMRLTGKSDTYELRGFRKSGEMIWTKINGAPVFDAAGEVVATIGIIEDITHKKQIELRLRMLSTAIEQSPVSVVITNPDGIIDYVNPAFERLTGYGLDEVLGKTPGILKSSIQSPVFYQEMWKTIQSGNIWEGQIQNRKKDGQTFWEKATISPIFDQENKIVHYLGIKEDITERKKNEEDRIASLERRRKEAEILAAIATSKNLSNGSVKDLTKEISQEVAKFFGVERFGVWLYKNKNSTLENVYTYLASADSFISEESLFYAEHLIGYETYIQSRYVGINDVLSDPRLLNHLDSYFLPNNIKSMLDAIIRVEGEIRGILCFEYVETSHDWQSDEVAFACQLADQFAIAILHSERLAADAEIEKLSMALEQSPVSIVITGIDGSIEYVNPVFTVQTGYQIWEVIGENLGILSQGLNEPEIFGEMW